MAWLTGWSYRKAVTIPASSATTNYKVRLSVVFADFNGHVNVDFSDVRFTLSDGSTLLKYDRKTYTASTSATFYFKDTDNIGAGASAYMYYGKSDATDASDPANTYAFYDPATADLTANYTERNIGEAAQHQTLQFSVDHYRINSSVASDTEMWELSGINGAAFEVQADYRIFQVTGQNTQFGICARYSASGVYYVRDIEANNLGVKRLEADKEPTPPNAAGMVSLGTGAVASYKTAGTWYSFLGRMAGSTLYGETSVAGETVTGTDATWSTGTWGIFAFCDVGFPVDFRNVYAREYVANDPTPTLGVEEGFTPTGSSGNPIAPEHGIADVASISTFNWPVVSGATTYDLQVSLSSGFATTVISLTGITTNSVSVGALPSNTTYYWRVRAVAINPGDWSSTWSFTTLPPPISVTGVILDAGDSEISDFTALMYDLDGGH